MAAKVVAAMAEGSGEAGMVPGMEAAAKAAATEEEEREGVKAGAV